MAGLLSAGIVVLSLSASAAHAPGARAHTDTEHVAASNATIEVTPANALVDQRLEITVTGLPPGHMITLNAETRASDGLTWRSRAVFRSSADGRLDLGAEAPVEGDYHGVDAMGLFWSAAPDAAGAGDHAFFDAPNPDQPVATRIDVMDGPSLLATKIVLRRQTASGIVAMPASGGVRGMLYVQSDGRRHPAVLVIGGSDGGYAEPGLSRLFAAHGFAALSIAYFGTAGLPPSLESVPMEDFTRALAWLRRQPSVDPRFVAVYGESRGSEPALWVAAHTEAANAVIARSPSFALWGGVTQSHLPGRAAWTLRGEPLPYIPNRLSVGFVLGYLWDVVTRTPVRQTPLFLGNLEDFGDTARVEIPVERIKGPVLLLAGKDDQIWPSALMAGKIWARLKGTHRPYDDELAIYEDVGHPIPFGYFPLAGDRRHIAFAVGGTADGTAKAQREAWPRILAFLKRAGAGQN